LSLSDTIGVATPESIHYLFSNLIPPYPDVEFGAHLHTQPFNWREKVAAAFEGGCRRYDGALKGYGGCPMAKDKLTGNMPTEHLVAFMNEQMSNLEINKDQLRKSMELAYEVFPHREVLNDD